MGKKISFAKATIQSDVKTMITDDLHIVFVPGIFGQIVDFIKDADTDDVCVIDALAIDDGLTLLDVSKMREYTSRWIGTYAASGASYGLIAHITQESVDRLVRECIDSLPITEL